MFPRKAISEKMSLCSCPGGIVGNRKSAASYETRKNDSGTSVLDYHYVIAKHQFKMGWVDETMR